MVSVPRRKEAATGFRAERRTRKRWSVSVTGKLFVPERQIEGECTVLDLSPSGAGLKSSCTAALGAHVVLYVDGFGRYEGVVAQRDRLRLGIRFTCTEAKRARIAQQIASFVQNGRVMPTHLRSDGRTRQGEALQSFRLASGNAVPCEIVSMALSGAALRTHIRRGWRGEISFGGMSAIIIRHTEVGIGVKFVGPAAPGPLPPVVRLDLTD